jgi:putative hydroxymethylpyrimidine transport system ATP-binding protein
VTAAPGPSSAAGRAPAIEFRGSAIIGGVTVFDSLCLAIPAGQWTCLLGPSGVGKSTLLRILAGLDDDIGGDRTVSTDDNMDLDGRVALIAQQDNLMPWLTVRDNVLLGNRVRREPADMARADVLITQVGLADHGHKKPGALSGGQRQRVALARTLMEDRSVVLLDEPFSALDARIRAEMQELAARLFGGRTVCLITHDPGEAARLGETVYVMGRSGLTAIEPPATPVIRPYDAPDVLTCQGQLLRLLRELP